jgi:hypothetical protein
MNVDSFFFGSGQAPSRFVRCSFDRLKANIFMLGFCRFESCRFTNVRLGDWHGEYAEVVDCQFSGRFRAGQFCGAPITPLANLDRETAPSPEHRALLLRERNEFHGNDFSAANLNIEFRLGIDLTQQRLPTGGDYVYLPSAPEAVDMGRALVNGWTDDRARTKALSVLDVLSERIAEGQRQLFLRRRWFKSMAAEMEPI